MYSQRADLLSHVGLCYKDNYFPECPFCAKSIKLIYRSISDTSVYVKHIARYIEEIAFGVVIRAYED